MNEARPAAVALAARWRVLCGLLISGFLLALPGGLLPLWGYHLEGDFSTAGNYFLALGAGVIAGGIAARRLARAARLNLLLSGACLAAAFALGLLSVASPPAPVWYRTLALFITGGAAGALNLAVLESLNPYYELNPARVTLTGGAFFSAGSVLAAISLARSFDEGGVTRLFAFIAIAPSAAAIFFSRQKIEAPSVNELPLAQTIKELRSTLAILFALLLFFQFGVEWSVAGWLPVFLIDRLGISPAASVGLLAGYWTALAAGRLIVSSLLGKVRHSRMLAASAACALLGCTAMLVAGSGFGAVAGLLLTGAGFSAIYPLAAERIASRFTYYHPGYFNGIFTFALTGGFLAPFALGHLADAYGLRVIPLAALAGSCAVFGIILLIWLGRKVSGD